MNREAGDPHPHSSAASPSKAHIWLMSGFLVVLVAAAFGQTIGFDFVNYDDAAYVYESKAVTQGFTISGIMEVFTHPQVSDWTPLNSLSHMAGWQFFGSWAGGHHLMNVFFHAVTSALLFMVLLRMTRAFGASAIVAALFAVHPLRVESVAWVAERKDVLSGMFFMLTLIAYERFARRGGGGSYLLVIACLALGLISKAILITTPFVLLLLDFWPLERMAHMSLKRLVLEKAPLILLCGVIAIIGFRVNDPAHSITQTFRLELRAENAVVAYATYVWQMIWPQNLAVPYPFPLRGVDQKVLLAAAATLIVLTGLAWAFRRGRPWLPVGWLWYLGMLAPVCGVVMPGEFARADRYTYLPHIGLYIAVVWTFRALFARVIVSRWVPAAVATAAIVACAVLAWRQTRHWQNSETLWRHAIAVTGPNSIAQKNLGYFYDRKGQNEAAATHYRKALEISPNNPDAHYSLGRLLVDTPAVDEAVSHLTLALQVKPDHAHARDTLGIAFARQGRMADAIDQFQKALSIDPQFAASENNLGNALLQTQRTAEALDHFRKAVAIDPHYADAYYNLGTALSQIGQTDEAIAQLQRAVELAPGMAKANNNLAVAEVKMRRIEAAAKHYEAALRSAPDLIDASNNLAWLLATCPRDGIRNGAKAVALATRAAGLVQSSNPIIMRTLAAAHAENGSFDEARLVAARAVDLAMAQNHPALANAVKEDIAGYKAGRALRDANLR